MKSKSGPVLNTVGDIGRCGAFLSSREVGNRYCVYGILNFHKY